MKNLLEGMKIATVFLDTNHRVVRFTEEATRIINLIPSDVGRPLGDIVTKLKYDKMMEDVQAVIQNLQFKDIPVQVQNGEWYKMRIMPYKNQEQVIQGVVLTFAPARELEQIHRASETVKNFARAMVDLSVEPVVVLTDDFLVIAANRLFCDLFTVTDDGCRNRSIYDVSNAHIEREQLQQLMETVLQKNTTQEGALDYRADGGNRKLKARARKIEGSYEDLPSIVLDIMPVRE